MAGLVFESFVARNEGEVKNHTRAKQLLQEALKNQRGKKDEAKDCTELITDILYERGGAGAYEGKTFVEARTPDKRLCTVALFDDHADDDIYVEFLCSDCKGAGRAMIEELVRIARGRGKTYVRLAAVPEAVGFYRKVGFEQDPDSRSGMGMRRRVGGGRTYRRRRQRKHGSASVRRHKTRHLLSRQNTARNL